MGLAPVGGPIIWSVLGRESPVLFAASTFGTRLQGSGSGILSPQPEVNLLRDLTHGETLAVQADNCLSVEDPLWAIWGQISAGTTMHGSTDLAALESLAVVLLAGAGALQDQGPLELGLLRRTAIGR